MFTTPALNYWELINYYNVCYKDFSKISNYINANCKSKNYNGKKIEISRDYKQILVIRLF